MPLYSRTLSRRRLRLLVPGQRRSAEDVDSTWADEDAPPDFEIDADSEAFDAGESAHDVASETDASEDIDDRSRTRITERTATADPLDEIGRLIAESRALQRQFQEHARRQLHVMRHLADSVDGAARKEVLHEIERLQTITGDADVRRRTIVRLPVREYKTTAVTQEATMRNRPAGFEVAQEVVETPGASAHYGRIAQRIAIHQRQRASHWRRFWRWMSRPR